MRVCDGGVVEGVCMMEAVCPQERAEGDREVLIAGSVGPYGACLHDGSEYTGDYVDHMTKEVSHVT